MVQVVKRIRPSRAGYQRERRERLKELDGERLKLSGRDGTFGEFIEHVRKEALKSDAKSAVMGIYKEMLKLEIGMGNTRGLSGDELAVMMLQARGELMEWRGNGNSPES
jgi:hypothetical protein